MDELIRLCRKAANEWRNNDAYYQAAVLIDSLCDRLEKSTAKPQTNADRIRSMSDEELCEMLTIGTGGFDCGVCRDSNACDRECELHCAEWLKNLQRTVSTMVDERCEDCTFCAELKPSLCCVVFPVVYHEGYVVEVFSNDRCEMFKRRGNDGR